MDVKPGIPEDRNKRGLIYIAGYGRSGSTWLEGVLSSHPQIQGLGEWGFLFRKLGCRPEILADLGVRCACGNILNRCEFWGPVLQRLSTAISDRVEDFIRLHKYVEGIGGMNKLHLNYQASSNREKNYRETEWQIYRAIWEQVPPATKFLIDSSKTAYSTARRPLALYELCGINLKVIHLVRDVRGVMWSMTSKGLNWHPGRRHPEKFWWPGIRTLSGWVFANKAADFLSTVLPKGRYLRIRYEDLMDNPKDVLDEIGAFISVDLHEVTERLLRGDLRSAGHQVLGNPGRAAEIIQLKPDVGWKTKLSLWHRLMARTIASHQMAKYGY